MNSEAMTSGVFACTHSRRERLDVTCVVLPFKNRAPVDTCLMRGNGLHSRSRAKRKSLIVKDLKSLLFFFLFFYPRLYFLFIFYFDTNPFSFFVNLLMAQELNTHRVLTIAGSVALVALTAYGVWKWNKSGKSPCYDRDTIY